MNLINLQYIVSVANFRSISKAAAHHYITQPAITKCINKVEKDLGVKLFDRSVIPIKLTYAGEKYIEGANKILSAKQDLDREMDEILKKKMDYVRLGIPSSRGTAWLPYILPSFRSAYPEIEVKIIEDTSRSLITHLMSGALDVCITSLPIDKSRLSYESIAEEQIMFVIAQNHAIFENKPVTNIPDMLRYIDPKVLDGQNFITLTPDQGLYYTIHQMFNKHNINPVVVLETPNVNTAYQLSTKNMGISISSVKRALNNRAIPEPIFCTADDPPFSRTLVAAYKKDRELSIPARNLIDMIKKIVNLHPSLKMPDFKVYKE
ncbi:MAG: LysR family transcriptional regulator [Desulfitobacteriaceae bacterium]|jgi:DNA-binding transcriptional LysR family regulator|nr:LysR family transcriptional regulator [Desulfitobacteriaceae bacterium]MDD4401897.1 LysR family transcriptional regulator [Desulfitobacteriaceae bacterium]